MAGKIPIQLTVNGSPRQVSVYPLTRLMDLLRDELGLTGVKEGCGEGECGACSVLMNGEVVDSCLIPAVQAEGATIVTVEGLTASEAAQALLDSGGVQCGICTPGMVAVAEKLSSRVEPLTEIEIRQALAGNLCRCTGYSKIVDAVRRASGATP